jgi:hypothetical protein
VVGIGSDVGNTASRRAFASVGIGPWISAMTITATAPYARSAPPSTRVFRILLSRLCFGLGIINP